MGALLIGTIVWLVLALVIGYLILQKVKESSPLGKEWENQK